MRRVDGVEVEPTRPHAVAEAAPITKRQDLRRKGKHDRNNTAQKRDDRSAERRIQI